MKWEKHTNCEPVHGSQFDVTHYRSGIYKLCSYRYFRNGPVKPYWQAYFVNPRAENWGDYVSRSDQHNQMLTLAQCKKLCTEHAKTYQPSKHQLMVAERSWQNWKR